MRFCDSTPIALPEQYKAALLAVRERMKDIHLKMLQLHCQSPGHTISLNQLAQMCNLTSTTACTSYSTYAQWIANEIRFTPENTKTKVSYLFALACGQEDVEKIHPDYEWIMRPELVTVLQAMKWA